MATVPAVDDSAVAAMKELEYLLAEALEMVRAEIVHKPCAHSWDYDSDDDPICVHCGATDVDALAAERGRLADEHIAKQRSDWQAQYMRGPHVSAEAFGQICHDEPCL